jgi:hypothetical protein
MMLAMGIQQVIVHPGKIDLIECNRVRRRKRNPVIARNRFRHHFAARSLNNQRMKLPVHFAVSGFVRLHQVALMEYFVPFMKALVLRMD